MLVREHSAETMDFLLYPVVLVAVGELDDAQAEIERLLEEQPQELETLNLLAKIQHIRGRLSEAFAGWARGQAGAPQGELARMRLLSLLQLARDPERGAGDFLVLGRDHLWRKPASFLDLERVFQLYLKRQPDEARAAARRLARKHHESDPEMYKLAVLADALVAELAGDLEGARGVLEELGRERGFDEDLDRALALARIYEQLGGEDYLQRAVNICEYLERSGGGVDELANLGRLATLYRALERAEEAAEYDRRFLAAFRRRMFRPGLDDLARAAAERYLPIPRLAAVRVPAAAVGADWPRRQRAVGLALTGEPAAARELLRAGRELLDRKYLADLAAIGGDLEQATARYLAAATEDPGDGRVIGWLLDHAAVAGVAAADPAGPAGPADPAPAIAVWFREPRRAAATAAALDAALRARPLRPVLWRRRAALHALLGEREEARRHTARAAALEATRQGSAVGRALSAAVYHFVGQGKGLVHEVWTERRPTAAGSGGRLEEVLGNLTAEMVSGIRNTFVSVREYARAKLPHLAADLANYNYAYKVTKEDEPSGGLSAGLPSALAFLSVFLNRPVPQDIASSGVLVADAHDVLVVGAVAEAELKVRGAYNRDLRLLLLPAANRADLANSAQVPRAVADELVRFVADLDQAVSLVFGEEIWLD